ncbi:hypothetical protein [Streptomyces sp. Da 82-17]|uniref:hypothetical protein n=1 Tax=Streptomyces sp. Da 82-17 TaxID=3377116 RepID=UPI0038D4E720
MNDQQRSLEVDDSEFMDIARDPQDAALLRKSLERLSQGVAGDTAKEMAQEVLAGRISLRDAVQIRAYSEALADGMRTFQEKWAEMSDSEREEAALQGERQRAEERAEIAKEQAAHGSSRSSQRARHDGSNWKL